MNFSEILDKIVSLINKYKLPLTQYYFLNDEQMKIQRELIATLEHGMNEYDNYQYSLYGESSGYDTVSIKYKGVTFIYANTKKIPE